MLNILYFVFIVSLCYWKYTFFCQNGYAYKQTKQAAGNHKEVGKRFVFRLFYWQEAEWNVGIKNLFGIYAWNRMCLFGSCILSNENSTCGVGQKVKISLRCVQLIRNRCASWQTIALVMNFVSKNVIAGLFTALNLSWATNFHMFCSWKLIWSWSIKFC